MFAEWQWHDTRVPWDLVSSSRAFIESLKTQQSKMIIGFTKNSDKTQSWFWARGWKQSQKGGKQKACLAKPKKKIGPGWMPKHLGLGGARRRSASARNCSSASERAHWSRPESWGNMRSLPGRFLGLISPLSVFNSVQRWWQSFHVWHFLENFAPFSG